MPFGHQLFRCFALALEQRRLLDVHIQHAPASYASFTIHITLKQQMQKASGRIDYECFTLLPPNFRFTSSH